MRYRAQTRVRELKFTVQVSQQACSPKTITRVLMLRIGYLDMIGGASGDMLLGALVDAGLPLDELRRELEKLRVDGFELTSSQVMRGGIDATLVVVNLDESGSRTRDWFEFERAIADSSLSDSVKTTSNRVFELLARAESAAHGVSKEETHLHELGTVDTLVDVVGVVAGFELLGIEKVHASPFPLSSGVSKSSHGVMAATAAATAEIYRLTGAPVRAGGMQAPVGEAVTPTGAAIVSTIASFRPVSLTTEKTGYGAGNRDPGSYPNVVGLWIGDLADFAHSVGLDPNRHDSDAGTDRVVLLETNIDDMTGEALGYVQENLMEAGALDVWITPIQMKKNRPAVMLSVLSEPDKKSSLLNIILAETTTLGIRQRPIDRHVTDRKFIVVATRHGDVRVKIRQIEGHFTSIHPEYEHCRKIAMQQQIPLREVIDAATAAARDQLGM